MSIKLSLSELKEIEKVCYETGAEYFELTRATISGLDILKMFYNTSVSDYPATVEVVIRGLQDLK